MRIAFLVAGALILLVVIGVFVVDSLMTPEYEVIRGIVIDAEPDAIHRWVGDLRNWKQWAPVGEGSGFELTYGATTTGVGGSQSWTAGAGRGELRFTKWDPARGVLYEMSFASPGNPTMTSSGGLAYDPAGDATRVTWRMRGSFGEGFGNGLRATQMDGRLGPVYEEGLKKLKKLVEGDR